MPVSVLERKIEKDLEKKLEPRLEKDLEKKVEKKLEKDVEKKVEKKVEKDLGAKIKEFEQKHEIASKSSIGIHVDDYDDIFSDFDPRPFSQRALSDDFLREAKKFVVEAKHGVLELNFLIPERVRSERIEAIVKKRLRDHFTRHYSDLLLDRKKSFNVGILKFFAGLGMTVSAGVLVFYFYEKNLFAAILISLLEPAGWFTFWTGLEQLFYEAHKMKPEIDFYKRMSKAEIRFESY